MIRQHTLLFNSLRKCFGSVSKKIKMADIAEAKSQKMDINYPTLESDMHYAIDGELYRERPLTDQKFLETMGSLNRNLQP